MGSSIGLGGGFFIMPMLLFLNLPFRVAVAVSLASIVANSVASSSVYSEKGLVDFRTGMLVESTTVVGALLGAHASYVIAEPVLKDVLAIVLIAVAIRMAAPGRRSIMPAWRPAGYMGSVVAGAVSGMLGVGGGILKVPILVGLFKLPLRRAIATSSYMIGITASAGVLVYMVHGSLDVVLAASGIIGASLGARLGSRTSLRAKEKALRLLLAAVLVIFALVMVLEEIGLMTWI